MSKVSAASNQQRSKFGSGRNCTSLNVAGGKKRTSSLSANHAMQPNFPTWAHLLLLLQKRFSLSKECTWRRMRLKRRCAIFFVPWGRLQKCWFFRLWYFWASARRPTSWVPGTETDPNTSSSSKRLTIVRESNFATDRLSKLAFYTLMGDLWAMSL